ncbi:hypothetical protein NT2_10_01370, partial [Caenibius tardaugens NBRC 16725]
WNPGSGSSVLLPEGVYADGAVGVRQVDEAGNEGTPTFLGPITVDLTDPAAINAELDNDTGSSASDGVTNDGTVVLTSVLEPGATWQYTTNGGTSWNPGSGSSVLLPERVRG